MIGAFRKSTAVFGAASPLSLSPGNHQPCPNHYENDADGGRDLFVMFGGDTDMRITKVDAVMLRVTGIDRVLLPGAVIVMAP